MGTHMTAVKAEAEEVLKGLSEQAARQQESVVDAGGCKDDRRCSYELMYAYKQAGYDKDLDVVYIPSNN